jgi:DNA gyrase subunit B
MSKAPSKKSSYDEDSVEVYRGLEGVRKRPGMYLGPKGWPMFFTCIREIADNGADEFLAGRNNYLHVHLDKKSMEIIVADKGEGIPVGINKTTKLSTLTTVFSELHAGAKFSGKTYSASGGTHGVGAAAVNAVCEFFTAWTFREGKWWATNFKDGKTVGVAKPTPLNKDVVSKLGFKPKSGTIIHFKPDVKIVSDSKSVKLDTKFIAQWLRNKSLLNPGLKIVLGVDEKQKEYFNKDLKPLIEQSLVEFDAQPMGKPLCHWDSKITLALQWSTYADDQGFMSYVSSINTSEHGKHEEGFRNALVKVLAAYKKKNDKFSPKDLYSGLIGHFDYKMSKAEFTSQTKERLSSDVTQDVEALVVPILEQFFNKNKSLARQVIKRAINVKKAKEEFTKAIKVIDEAKKTSKGVIPPGMHTACPRCSPAKRELYAVEGDSAAGCFTYDTMVYTTNGPLPIGALKELHEKGRSFKGYAFDGNKCVIVPLVDPRITKSVKTLIELEFETKIKCTPEHLFMLEDGSWIEAQNLSIGQKVQSGLEYCGGQYVHKNCSIGVKAIRTISLDTAVPVYDLTVDTYHNFLLGNGAVVHNSAKKARDKTYQEIIRLDGKIINAAKNKLVKVLSSEAIQYLLTAIGYNFDAHKKGEAVDKKLRIGKLFTLADADVDGGHITVLLLTLIYKLVPNMFDEMQVYVVDAPLFSAYYKGRRYYGKTFKSVEKQLPKGGKSSIVRSKGWGEIGVDTLREIAFDPKTRNILRVVPVKGKQAVKFERLVSSDTTARKELLGLN